MKQRQLPADNNAGRSTLQPQCLQTNLAQQLLGIRRTELSHGVSLPVLHRSAPLHCPSTYYSSGKQGSDLALATCQPLTLTVSSGPLRHDGLFCLHVICVYRVWPKKESYTNTLPVSACTCPTSIDAPPCNDRSVHPPASKRENQRGRTSTGHAHALRPPSAKSPP